jgi:hypothetical protein
MNKINFNKYNLFILIKKKWKINFSHKKLKQFLTIYIQNIYINFKII